MSELVPGTEIEAIVGVARDKSRHIAKIVSAEDKIYILHSEICINEHSDLRECQFSKALDKGLHPSWSGKADTACGVGLYGGYLWLGWEVE